MDYKTIKERVTIPMVLARYGITPVKGRCKCPVHRGDNKTAFSVHSQDQSATCHTKCDRTFDIFSLVAELEKINTEQARIRIMEWFHLAEATKKPKTPAKKKVEARRKVYIYRNTDGTERFKVCRIEYTDGSKRFMYKTGDVYTLTDETKILYNADKLNASNLPIFICEGEKTADAVDGMGFIATTCPCGSGGWLDRYADLLKDKKVIIMPDADEHGEKWKDTVLESLRGKVEQAQILPMPDDFILTHPEFKGHDFADYLDKMGRVKGMALLWDGLKNAEVMPCGVDRSGLGLVEDGFRAIEDRIKSGVRTDVFSFGEWIPSMPVVANRGDLVVLLAVTGAGKSQFLHNIPFHIRHCNYAIFDLELSFEALCWRYGMIENRMSGETLHNCIKYGRPYVKPDVSHVNIMKVPALTVPKIRDSVDALEQAQQREIHVVGVDYIGLMSGFGDSYELTSRNVEAFKAYVAETGRVGVLTSQIGRKPVADRADAANICPSAFDAKNSGSVENSSQVLFGLWNNALYADRQYLRCLKWTHGKRPRRDVVLANDNMHITEDTAMTKNMLENEQS